MKTRNHESRLGRLADPSAEEFRKPLSLSKRWQPPELIGFYESMVRIRLVEEAIAGLELSGESNCPCHLGIGQEAAAVGVAAGLRSSDRAFGAHRSHSHFLAMGGTSESLIAEILGKATGCSKGMGGSMHLYGETFGFMGSVPIVAGTIPLAVGAGLAAKMDGNGDIAVAFFGDGASEEGVIHESMNLASQYELPVLFVCENNLYSSHLDIKQRQPTDTISRYADAHCVESFVVDGNDVVSVADAACDIISNIRAGKGPGFVEAITYRWRGHVGANENIDVGVRRSAEDMAAWKTRDPIRRLETAIIKKYPELDGDIESKFEAVELEIKDAVRSAKKAPFPELAQNLEVLFSRGRRA